MVFVLKYLSVYYGDKLWRIMIAVQTVIAVLELVGRGRIKGETCEPAQGAEEKRQDSWIGWECRVRLGLVKKGKPL